MQRAAVMAKLAAHEGDVVCFRPDGRRVRREIENGPVVGCSGRLLLLQISVIYLLVCCAR